MDLKEKKKNHLYRTQNFLNFVAITAHEISTIIINQPKLAGAKKRKNNIKKKTKKNEPS